jgi:predicted amidohydrolase YtcJ
MKHLVFYSIIAIFLLPLFSCKQTKRVDLIIKDATIYTLDKNFSKASAIIIDEGKIVDVGGDALLQFYQSDSVVSAKGQFVYPGFMDAHCHFSGYAMDQYKLNLYGVKSYQTMVDSIVAYAKTNKREWIEGRLWNEQIWDIKDFPTKDTLDKLFPNTPILLMRIDGHAVLCNQKALDIAGITSQTKIENGSIQNRNGKLTGILIDKAVDLVKSHIPKLTYEEALPYFLETQTLFYENGLTSFVDCGLENETVQWMKKAYDDAKLNIRASVMLLDSKENLDQYLSQSPLRTDRFHIIGFKVFADGSLGSHGAFMLDDYEDMHNHHGYLLKSIDSIAIIAEHVYQSKYQLNIHAIGDAANREVLKVYASVLNPQNDRRWRIEHAQVVHPDDFHYFEDNKIIPSVQPTHATSDMTWAEKRIGRKRLQTAYAYNQLLQTNKWLPLGTDFPVENLNPLHTFYAAVFRQDAKLHPVGGFQIENALSREEALRGITIWAAQSVFEEDVKGSLEKGKFADFVILPIDLMKANPSEIYEAKIHSLFIHGNKAYPKN